VPETTADVCPSVVGLFPCALIFVDHINSALVR
jgi:hypothetical protein